MTIAGFFIILPHGPNWQHWFGAFNDRVRLKQETKQTEKTDLIFDFLKKKQDLQNKIRLFVVYILGLEKDVWKERMITTTMTTTTITTIIIINGFFSIEFNQWNEKKTKWLFQW